MYPTPRRRLGAGALALVIAAALVPASGTAAAVPASPFGAAFAQRFAAPPADAKPKIRYWWACGDITPAAIDAEVRQIADRGFGAAEIQCMLSTKPKEEGWGSPALSDRFERAIEAGRRYGVRIDLTVGPSWPLVVPGVTPDSPEAAQEIAYGRAVVEGGTTFAGPVPAAPEPKAGVSEQTLVALQAVRCAGSCTAAKPVKLDKSSLTDLTGSVREGTVSWKAPAGGQWLLLAYWQRGTGQASVAGQAVSGEAAHVVDHFGAAGARAATGYWDSRVLTPDMRRLLKRNGGDLFEDSLELDSAQHWTAKLPERFEKLRGYSLRDNLPVLFIDKIHRQYTQATPDDTPDFEFTDGGGARVRDDYYRTLTDLYIGEHVEPLKKWAHARGLRFRAQPYGTTIDTPTIGSALDVNETESLGLRPGYTDEPFRWISGGAVHLAGQKTYSLECCATLGDAYAQTWPQMLEHFNTAFAHGVNQVVYHGFATERALGTPWPGFSPFTFQGGNGFSEAWGPRQPTWDDTSKITGWTSRMQYVLRQGRPAVDLAVYRDGHGTAVREPDGAAGFTYDFAGPGQLEGTRVRNRRLAPDGPAYRALIVDRQETMPVATARTLLAHARGGLPLVVVGDPPGRTPGARDAARQDAELAGLVRRLLAQPSVRHVTAQDRLPAALKELGVRASAEAGSPGLMTVRRDLSAGRLYYLHNPTSATITADVSLEGTGTPYTLDAWTGKITPAGRYRSDRTRTTLPIVLAPGGSTVIALGGGEAPHATGTSGGEILVGDDGPFLRAAKGGAYTVTRDDGADVRLTVPAVADPQRLDGWRLSVEDWHRGADGGRAITHHEIDLKGLKPWSEIPALRDVSGVGTYRTTVRLDRADGAYLDLGQVTDTFEVTVNGRTLPPPDQVGRRIDLGGHLRPGTNTITVRVATTLRNRLRVTDGFPGQAAWPRQEYGLIGPVRLTPYRQVPVRR
ncbi:glycosyl hydrolase [Spirillospora sp. NPDC029432]|uniref:glycosyl hydrolase n=1 Tax=Spirillospora sp. NPDC029432 TaxID=3154599 RepID=UPI003451D321